MLFQTLSRIWHSCPWTLGLCGLMLLCNLELFAGGSEAAQPVLRWLEYDRPAISDGQVWRLLTGNLVHWSREHFLLDIGVFLLVGILYERSLGRAYPWILLLSGAAVGVSLFALVPEMTLYRGFSGVDSGQFAAVLCLEVRQSLRDGNRWWFVGPAAIVFVVKLASESLTGQPFFGTDRLGDLGDPLALAHVAGVVGVLALFPVWPDRAGSVRPLSRQTSLHRGRCRMHQAAARRTEQAAQERPGSMIRRPPAARSRSEGWLTTAVAEN